MKNILFAWLLLSGFLLSSCGSKEPKSPGTGESPTISGEIDFDKMAEGFCNCMRPMFEFQERVMKLAQEGKNEEIEALREQALKVQTDGESCVLDLESKYGVVEGTENETKATEALKKACPDIMTLMGAAAGAFEE